MIVGKWLGDHALAAVSSSSSLIYLLVDLFNGLFTGAGILVANLFGRGDREKLSHAVHTTMALGLLTGVLLTILGTLLAPVLLRAVDTPDVVIAESLSYFRIFFAGSLAFVMYNCCTGILHNIGDSVRPLLYLAAACAINIVLDIIFVGLLDGGVVSVALATILAQGLSAALCLRRLCREQTVYQVFLPRVKIYPASCREILAYGIPSGFQNAVIAFSNVVVQANINLFDVKAIAGCGVWSKLEGVAVLSIVSFSMALSTFAGQNMGAGNNMRLRRGSGYGILACGGLAAVTGAVLFAFAPWLTALFKNDPEIIAFSVMRAHMVTPFFCLLGISNCIGGILRGMGKAKQSMAVYLFAWCAVRIAFISILFILQYRRMLRQLHDNF